MVAETGFYDKSYIMHYADNGGFVYKGIKGGEKVKPYFETKVVKVKKNVNCQHEYKVLHYKCIKCGEEHKRYEIDSEPKPVGNWVNGENLDKIKFPVPCSYIKKGKKRYGFFSMNNGYYYIADLEQKKVQHDVSNPGDHNLENFIKEHNIHILKGKIILFEEE